MSFDTANLRKFTEAGKRVEKRLTITSWNSFGLPTKFWNDHNLDDFRYVVLFYDPDQMLVGLHFTNDDKEPSKFTISKGKQGYGGGFVANSFFKLNGLESRDYRGRYEWEKRNIDGVGEVFLFMLKKRTEGNIGINEVSNAV